MSLEETLGAVLLALLVLAALTWAHLRFWTRRLEPMRRYALTERLATEDGSAIELRRVTPEDVSEIDRVEDAEPADLPPVLVVHGIGIDHRNNDMFDGRSLVRSLAARGRDVWLLTLRSGRLDHGWRERSLVSFERMARFDVPLAVREVLARSGAQKLDYLGFSMGGMLLYGGIALGTLDPAILRRVAVVGSPGRVHPPMWIMGWLARTFPVAWVPSVPLAMPSRLVAFVAGYLRTPIHRVIIEPAEFDPPDVGAALVTIRDIPRALLRDFALFIRAGRLEVAGVDVLAALAPVTVPAVFVAGAGDHVAPPEAVRAGHDAWGAAVSVEKRWHLAGRAHGSASDYGHGDLVMGKNAPRDVFPVVLTHLGEE